jgi:hypothetical protein
MPSAPEQVHVIRRDRLSDPSAIAERFDLSQRLRELSSIDFDSLQFALAVPRGLMPHPTAPIGDRAIALLTWAGNPSGCGLQQVSEILDRSAWNPSNTSAPPGDVADKATPPLPVPSGHPELLLVSRLESAAIPGNRQEDVISAIDCVLTSDALHLQTRLELLLKRAVLYQQIGRLGAASRALSLYRRTANGPVDTRYHICRGKLISQSNHDPAAFREYVERLQSKRTRAAAGGGPDLAPLYWRLAVLTAPRDRVEAARYLDHHEASVASDGHQRAHSAQCQALAHLATWDQTGRLAAAARRSSENLLHEAFTSYARLDTFHHRDKCIGSNLALLAMLSYTRDRPRRFYAALLSARALFELRGVAPRHEAMAEISRILRHSNPEEYDLLFGRSLSNFISDHSSGALIRELQLDLSSWISQQDSSVDTALALYQQFTTPFL